MKKIILAIIIVVIVLSFTFPIYADQPANPGLMGQAVSEKAAFYPGAIADAIAEAKDNLIPELFKNYGQSYLVWLSWAGIPPKHTP
jgi:hypothetical protein